MMADKKFFYEEVEKIRDVVVGRPEPPSQFSMDKLMPEQTEEEDLDEIQKKVYAHLREQKAPPTCRNIIHAMFAMHYADWIGHDDCTPTCPYENSQANGL